MKQLYSRHESRTSILPRQDRRTSTTKKPISINSETDSDEEVDLKAPAQDEDKRKSLRASLAGIEVTNRLGLVSFL